MQDDDSGGTQPCFAHEMVGGHAVDPETRRDVARFRKSERARLYQLRKALSQGERQVQTACVIDRLEQMFGDVADTTFGVYWPIRGELDLRPWMERLHGRGARVALPVVVEKGSPVAFHRWAPRCKMERGVWNIPVPAEAERLRPDIVIVPLVGVDEACFRLGNGGGYYDMTLAALDPAPHKVAVGQDFCRVKTIFPLPWDIGMDSVVLGDGTVMRSQE